MHLLVQYLKVFGFHGNYVESDLDFGLNIVIVAKYFIIIFIFIIEEYLQEDYQNYMFK